MEQKRIKGLIHVRWKQRLKNCSTKTVIAKSNTGMTETELDQAVAYEDEVMDIIKQFNLIGKYLINGYKHIRQQ